MGQVGFIDQIRGENQNVRDHKLEKSEFGEDDMGKAHAEEIETR